MWANTQRINNVQWQGMRTRDGTNDDKRDVVRNKICGGTVCEKEGQISAGGAVKEKARQRPPRDK